MTVSTYQSEEIQLAKDDVRWDAVVRRSPEADGQFWYGVRTTGVFCRPSCAARLPRRENVAFYGSIDDALRAGLRPCKRCRPDESSSADRHAELIAQACRTIEQADEQPSLETLAAEAGISPYHFHRLFKQATGVTPKAYADAHRARKVRTELAQSDSVTSAIYEAGFGSNGRFYEAAPALLGMTPTSFRSGGAGSTIRFAVGQCSLGAILVAATDRGICSIALGDEADKLLREFQDQFPNAQIVGGDPEFERVVAQVVGYVEEPWRGLDLPLDVRGTAFQRRVWQALREIPVGKTASYQEIASRIDHPGAAQAVARACATNPLAVAIPCHRVVRTDGSLSGYRWGIERKQSLLRREAR